MNEIVNKFLLAGDKLMLEMHLKQLVLLDKSRFTYGACELFTKIKEIIQQFKQAGDSSYIYKSELDKVCFQHNMAFNIAKSPKYDGY